jgi:aldose 1-epimerase
MCLVAPSLAGGTEAKKMVGVYVLKKGNFSVKMTNWGATVMSIILPDSKGTMNKLCLNTQKIMWPVKFQWAMG